MFLSSTGASQSGGPDIQKRNTVGDNWQMRPGEDFEIVFKKQSVSPTVFVPRESPWVTEKALNIWSNGGCTTNETIYSHFQKESDHKKGTFFLLFPNKLNTRYFGLTLMKRLFLWWNSWHFKREHLCNEPLKFWHLSALRFSLVSRQDGGVYFTDGSSATSFHSSQTNKWLIKYS